MKSEIETSRRSAMKKAKRIVVTSVGIILLAGIISQPTDRSAAAEPDELRSLKAENKALRAQVAKLHKVKAENKALRAQVAKLEKRITAVKETVALLRAGPSTKPAATTQKGAEPILKPSITICTGPNLLHWQGSYQGFWKRYEDQEGTESNPIRAKWARDHYNGASVIVVGRISSISTYSDGSPSITLGTRPRRPGRPKNFIELQFPPMKRYQGGAKGRQKVQGKRLADQIYSISKGDLIVVRGTWSCEYRRVVKCRLVKRRKGARK